MGKKMEKEPVVMVVEDEDPIRSFIRINLERGGFRVLEAADGEEALLFLAESVPHLVLLDLKLPGMDGYTVCRHLREKYPHVAVIMLTAKGQDWERVMGLELGADDYIVKPFNPPELVARVRAVLRRLAAGTVEPEDGLRCGALEIFPAARVVRKGGVPLEVPPREYELLTFLIRHPNVAFTRDQLLDAVWGSDYIGDPRTVDVHIRRLRAKVEDDPTRPRYLETVWGTGYRWRGSHDAL